MDINILDVVSVLGLPLPSEGKRQYNISCPCCDNKNGTHLNINIQKNVFHCPRCDIHGGLLALYCVFTGMEDTAVNRKKAYQLVKDGVASPIVSKPRYEPKKSKELPLASADVRNATYTAFLHYLGLSNEHRKNLHNRGLTDEDISRLCYKSSPMKNCQKLCRLLIESGHTLEGVPGFWKRGDNWTVGDGKTGILIPFRDIHGRILGIQKRLDVPEGNRKFRWMSSADFPFGTKAESWIHFVGNPNSSVVILTEGGMKADVINALSGKTVLAVPGVNSIQRLKAVIEELHEKYGVEVIKTAFDMDYVSNKFVEKAYNTLLGMLEETGLRYHVLIWNKDYKGLDDYLYFKLFIENKGDE